MKYLNIFLRNGVMFLLVSCRQTTVVDATEDEVVDVKIVSSICTKETGR
jgi:hypothetical protein